MEIIQRFIVTLQLKNGNLVYVNTGRLMNDGHNETGTGERKLIWDEENRLLAVDDNGFVSNYWYDADGERTVKTSGESDQVYVNGVFSGGSTNTAKFSLYVSPYLVANQGGRYTKHIYAGSQRIVSKVGDFASYGSDPRRIEYAGANTDGLSVDYKAKYAAQQQVIKDNYKFFDVPYNGTDNDNYADGEGFCCNDGSMEAAMAQAQKAQVRAVARSFKDPDNYENLQFFYHPDHLGSSSFITNLEGEVVQHIEYVPFGEVFIEERNNVWNTPYLFNAKEFDEETGMYYYGARYYEPRLCLWMACDSETELYPNISGYAYCLNNPVKLKDPDGNHVEVTLNEENKYIVTGGVLNNDKNIYIMKDGKRTGEILGKSLTKYSFFGSNNKVVVGAPIDMSDKSGQNFFDKDIVESKIDVIYYMANATGGQKYDFKTVGIKDRGNMSKTQYSYRGMPFTDENGNKFIASARDIGNYSAGYMAGISGQGWEASRAAFDALESVQMRKFSTEAMVSQAAEKAGFDRGHKKYWQQQYEVQRILQEGRVNTWNAIKGWFGSLFGK